MSNHQWTACGVISAFLVPIMAAVIMMYSDVETMKITKAEIREVSELRLEYTKQMTKNTAAIEGLVDVTKDIKEFLVDRYAPVTN